MEEILFLKHIIQLELNQDTKLDCIIVGAGIVGLTTAYIYKESFTDHKVLVIDKENRIFNHQSGRNSGVIHSGIYYAPKSHKAKNCITGYKMLINFAKENNIPYKITGKLIVATEESDLKALDKLYQNGLKNGLKGIKLLERDEALKIEPYCKSIIKAIYVPQSGIIDYLAVGFKLLEKFKKLGGSLKLNTELLSFKQKDGTIKIKTSKGVLLSNKIIICSGISSDKFISNSLRKKYRIFPFKGEYYYLKSSVNDYVRGLVYPVPDLNFPFLGVHLTTTTCGKVEAGPNAVLSLSRYGYKRNSFNISDFLKIISWRGFWIFSLKFWKIGLFEMYRSFSKRQFTRSIQKLVPDIKKSDLIQGKSGIRAQIMMDNGELLDDFMIESNRNIFTVVNAPSPAATAAFAISEQIINYVVKNET